MSSKERFLEDLKTKATVVDGVYYWKSNNRVVPPWCWSEVGLFSSKKQYLAREYEVSEALKDFKRNTPRMTQEQLFEMRAAFGPGVDVENITTGETIKT